MSLKRIGVTLTEYQMTIIDKKRTGIKRTEFIRRIVDEWIEKNNLKTEETHDNNKRK